MNFKAFYICCIFALIPRIPAAAQDANAAAVEKNQVGVFAGVNFTLSRALDPGSILPGGDSNLTSKPSLALGADYDRLIISADWMALYGGADFVGTPLNVKLNQPPVDASPQYRYVLVTPHVKIKFHSDRKLSPWLSAGGGYAYFRGTPPTASVNSFSQNIGRAVIEVGGGFDTQPITHVLGFPVGFRVEVRDFYSGVPDYDVTLLHNHQHNIVAGAGLVIRF